MKSTSESRRDCQKEGCGKHPYCRDLCRKHYREFRRVNPLPGSTRCGYLDCNYYATIKGYCDVHYNKAREMKLIPSHLCSAPECVKPVQAKKLCRRHYGEAYRSGEVGRTTECAFSGCGRRTWAKGYCSTHYNQSNSGKTLTRIREVGDWGPWYTSDKGYVSRVRTNPSTGKQEHQKQHRLVMEQHLGRPLREKENVHHINGIRDDNRIENLELWSKSHPSGQRVSDRIRDALEVLEMYGDDPSKWS